MEISIPSVYVVDEPVLTPETIAGLAMQELQRYMGFYAVRFRVFHPYFQPLTFAIDEVCRTAHF